MDAFLRQLNSINFYLILRSYGHALIIIVSAILCLDSKAESQNHKEKNSDKPQIIGDYPLLDDEIHYPAEPLFDDPFLNNIDTLLKDQSPNSESDVKKTYYSENVHLNVQIRNESAVRMKSPNEITKIRKEILLSQKIDLFSNIKLKSQQRFFYDSAFDVNDYLFYSFLTLFRVDWSFDSFRSVLIVE